jgi:DNA-binding MarR family transcriptional regulator
MKKIEDTARLTSSMFTLGRLMREEFHKKAQKSSCSFLHMQTLRYVKEENRPFMRDVARYLLITPPAATLLIDGLVREGLLTRILDKNDRRAVRLEITKKGNLLFARAARDAKQTLASVFAPLDRKEKEQFTTMLEKVIKGT